MRKVHFIAIGGAAMHNLAIAISKKNDFAVTGSDDEIFEPSYSRLKENELLPETFGWFPEKIHKGLSAVIVGMSAKGNNPELLKAKELGLKIYSYPEYLFQQSRSKTRIVVGGSHGKSMTTAMILFVLKKLKIDADYMVGTQIEGFDNMVKLSYEARIAVFEGDEYLTSPIDPRPKFHIYKPHVAVLTGIAWDHIDVFPNFKKYVEQYKKFIELMEVQGRLIYFAEDENLSTICENLRRDIVSFSYDLPEYEVREGITYLKTKKGDVPLQIFGEHNLLYLNAARLACKQIGVTDQRFYDTISEFKGAALRLEKMGENAETIIYNDYANSPSKVKASLNALKTQYPKKKIIACFELFTYSSLSVNFLPQYASTMQNAELAFVLYNPENSIKQNLPPLDITTIKNSFNHNNLHVFNTSEEFENALSQLDYKNSLIVMMGSNEFSGFDTVGFAEKVIGGLVNGD